MFLSGVLFVLFLAGFWLYCLTRRRRMADRLLMADAFARHPATRARLADPRYRPRPTGPDDDEDFLRQLAARIREGN